MADIQQRSPPRIWAHYTMAPLVTQDRRHLFVTPCPKRRYYVFLVSQKAKPAPGASGEPAHYHMISRAGGVSTLHSLGAINLSNPNRAHFSGRGSSCSAPECAHASINPLGGGGRHTGGGEAGDTGGGRKGGPGRQTDIWRGLMSHTLGRGEQRQKG